MAPSKLTRPIVPSITARGIATRSKGTNQAAIISKDIRGKRKADGSPTKENGVKRSAFCDVTNAISKVKNVDEKVKILTKNHMVVKKVTVHQKVLPSVKTVIKPRQNENLAPPPAPGNKVHTRASCRNVAPNQTAQKPKEVQKETVATKKVKTRLSNEFEKTHDSLYSTALEDV